MAPRSQHTDCTIFCNVQHWFVAIFLFVAVAASSVGVYKTHVGPGGAIDFGSTAGSLALLAFTAALVAWSHKVRCCIRGSCCSAK